jgi:glycosyltransferase involved in cell wall biosynthesis
VRIGLVVPGFSATPSDWCIPALRHFIDRLSESDDVRVVTLRYPYRAARYTIGRAEVVALGGAQRRGLASVRVWQRGLGAVLGEHRRRPFDVLHAFWATESGLLAALAGRVLGRPSLVSLAGGELVGLREIGYGDQLARAQRLKVSASLRLASGVTAGSRYQLGLAQRRVPRARRRRLEQAPLGVDLRLFRPAEGAAGAPRLVHVGALTGVKDQAMLLRGFAELRRRLPSATLDVVGGGPLRSDLERLAEQLGVADKVAWRGETPHDALPPTYAGGTVFVLSSRHEAQGMVALEAAACCRPVVGTRVGVLPELEPEAGRTVAVGDASALAEALAEVCTDEAHSRRLGAAARRLVEADFGLDACVERFRGIYARLLASG